MLKLKDVKESTKAVFDAGPLTIPDPGPVWQRKLEALEEGKLDQQRAAAIFDMRCEQADKMGFMRLTSGQAVEMLMGEAHTDTKERDDVPRQTYEWFYNHHDGVLLEKDKCNWGGFPIDFWRMERKSFWYMPPFAKVEKWRCRFSKLDYLKREIPYGVLLRINELKELKLFNVFNIVAPLEAFERNTDIDPIVLATIWEVPPRDKDKGSTAGQAQHYFLAQW